MLRASHDRSFRIPRPQRDLVNLRQLAAIAGVCLSVGVALSGVIRERESHGDARHAYEAPGREDEDWEAAALAAAPAVATVQTLQTLGAAIQTETSISAATSQLPAATPLPSVTALAADSSSSMPAALAHAGKREHAAAADLGNSGEPPKLALQRGAVSYHCDPRAAKRGKCPRDRALEARVWRVLARLSACRDATRELGRAELHLRLTPDAASIASFSAPAIAQSLNLRAVSRCVAGELSQMKTTRKVDRFELDMGFGLSGRN